MGKGYVRAVCSSKERGTLKHNVGNGCLKEGFGLLGDAHAGTTGWQISILLEELMDPAIKALGKKPEPGSFAENLLISGLPENRVSDGKEDPAKHTYSYRGFSLLAEQGRFGRILTGGRVKTGDPVEIVEGLAPH